ncbi:MAG: energy-coupling factor transporter transmembrane component T [Anaerolineae bacterium]
MGETRYHTLAWLTWLLAAALWALLNQQPLPRLLLCLSVGGVFVACAPASEVRRGWAAFIRLGLIAWGVALVFNLFSVHVGGHVLFTLPRSWPIVGGPITLEALLYGMASGVGLFAILLVFAAFNAVVDAHRLLRWVPAGLFGAGLVVSIGITFVPHLVASWHEIRDAQRVRGHRVRGVRALVPLFVPLLTTALERSLTLAESMEARGFGGVAREGSKGLQTAAPGLSVGGLCLVLGGLVAHSFAVVSNLAGWGAVVGGLLAMLAAVALRGRAVRRGRYHRECWGRADAGVVVPSLLSLGILVALKVWLPQILYYYPYPPYSPWPRFDPLAGFASLLLSAPAVWRILAGNAGQEVRA